MAATDTGLTALVSLLRLQGVAAEPAQLHHQLGLAGKPVGVVEMVRCARQLGLKARILSTRWARLARTPLPGIAELRDGSFLVVGKATDDKVLVHMPGASQAEIMSQQQFEAAWTGRLVLMMRRARLGDVARRFDIGWFAGALNKYRGLLGEVLLASFCLQFFALLTPLFFQVVIDKVLVHRSLTTLDVVVRRPRRRRRVRDRARHPAHLPVRPYHQPHRRRAGRAAVPPSHGAADRLFPGRRVGDSVARVRELENIRIFLTSSALTLVIDLFFTLVFVAVMFFYSPLLTWIVLGGLSVLHRHLACRGAAVPPPARREVQARRGKPGLPGRERRRRRDRQGHGGRAADAAPLGGPARGLRLGQLPRAQPRQHDEPDPCSSSTSW